MSFTHGIEITKFIDCCQLNYELLTNFSGSTL